MSRPPIKPKRGAVREDELAEFDWLVSTIKPLPPYFERLVSRFPSLTMNGYWEAQAVSPPIATQLRRMGQTIMRIGNREGTWSSTDHEFVDLVLTFELGTFGLMPNHALQAVAEGVRVEAIEALRHGREEDLTADEAFLLTFIRAVIAGQLTDVLWSRMEHRLGSPRGVYEYVYLILHLWLSMRMHQALGNSEISQSDFDDVLRDLREGTAELPPKGSDGSGGHDGDHQAAGAATRERQ